MSTPTGHRFEERLLTALLERHPARTGEPVPEPAPRPHRSRRRRAWRLTLAGATGLAVAATGLAAAGVFTPAPSGSVLSARTLAYQADQALTRLNPGSIAYTREVFSFSGEGVASVNLMWERSTGQGKRIVQTWRQEQFYGSDGQPGPALQLNQDTSGVYRYEQVTSRDVDYAHHTWSPDNYHVNDTYPLFPSTAQDIQEIRQLLRNGTFYVIGRVQLHGQPAIEIARRHQWVRIWLDPRTYLTLQDEQRSSGLDNVERYTTIEYSWLPPTPANLRQLVAPIPPGFHRTGNIGQ